MMRFSDLLEALAGHELNVVGPCISLVNPDALDAETFGALLEHMPFVARYVQLTTGTDPSEEINFVFPGWMTPGIVKRPATVTAGPAGQTLAHEREEHPSRMGRDDRWGGD